MSLGYPPLRPVPESHTVSAPADGPYGTTDLMSNGINKHAVRNTINLSHPLEHTEQNWRENQEKMDFAMLRNMQGIHAPLRLQMERKTADKIQRLPCLHSSNLMKDTLTGKLDTIEYDDILNNPMESEVMGQPHMLLERKLQF